MFFNEDHLRITKVRTNNGTTPVYDEQERPLKKIVFAPDNPQTRKLFEDQNSRLPNPLKMKIERVSGYKPQPVAQPTVNEEMEKMKAQLEKLQSEKQALEQQLSDKKNSSADTATNNSTDAKPSANGSGAKQNAKHEAA